MRTTNLEEQVFRFILTHKKVDTSTLVSNFIKLKYTKQGVYKVLRTLKIKGKILWVKTRIEIHLLWLHDEIEQLAQYLPKKELIFEEFSGRKKIYKVKTLTELENVYGQIFISLISSLQEVKNYLFYDIHNFTYVNTVPIVDWYIDFIFKKRARVCLLIGSLSPLDLELKRKSRMRDIEIHCAGKKWSMHLSVLGEYIIYVYINKKIANEIDSIFNTCNENTARKPIEILYEEKSTHRIVVEKNKVKAQEIEKVFRKYFVLN